MGRLRRAIEAQKTPEEYNNFCQKYRIPRRGPALVAGTWMVPCVDVEA